jgi:hypothetical protein
MELLLLTAIRNVTFSKSRGLEFLLVPWLFFRPFPACHAIDFRSHLNLPLCIASHITQFLDVKHEGPFLIRNPVISCVFLRTYEYYYGFQVDAAWKDLTKT